MSWQIAEVVLTCLALCGLYALFHYSRLFKDRTLDEVIGYLRKVDWPEANRLFDVYEEEKLMGFWTRRDFRRSQRARLDRAAEFLECMYHNNRIFLQWGSTEHKDMLHHHLQYEPETLESIVQLVKTARRFRRIALVTMFRIGFLSLLHFDKLHFLPIPSIAALRKVGGADLLQSFEAVRDAAAKLAGTAYGEEYAEEIMGSV